MQRDAQAPERATTEVRRALLRGGLARAANRTAKDLAPNLTVAAGRDPRLAA